MRFHFGVSMGPEQLLVILLVLVILAYAAYRWLRRAVEREI